MNTYLKQQKGLAWFLAGVVYVLVYGFRIGFPGEMYYDEVYFVKTAREILALSGYTDAVQPPFGKLLMALSILILGDHSWAWRLPSFLAGFGCLVLIYKITKDFSGSARLAFFSTFLFALDGLAFTQARIGLLNAPMLFFVLLSVWCLMRNAVTREWPRTKAFLWAGIFWGLAVATRLVAVTAVVLHVLLILKLWKETEDSKAKLVQASFLLFFGTAVVIYFSTFFIIPFIHGYDWTTIFRLQTHFLNYHLHLKETHTYGSAWWSWPLLVRPIWYHFEQIRYHFEHIRQGGGVSVIGIFCIGNPLIFWQISLGVGFVILQFLKGIGVRPLGQGSGMGSDPNRSWFLAFILLGFFSQWLQWAPVSRVTFFHYFYTALPFAVMALAVLLDRLWNWKPLGPWAVSIYGAAVLGMFIYWYPLLNGFLVPEPFFRQHMWFKQWI